MGSRPRSPQAASNGATSSSGSNGLATSTLPGGGSRFNSLARQSSISSLTLDEFQNVLTEPGKNFGSMNMDEFLKSIWTVEESPAMAAAMASVGDTGQGSGGMLTRQPSLKSQGSITLPRTLSRKTMDEVWKDIHRGSSGNSGSGGEPPVGASPQDRTQTFGEMTLEDFLAKAGVMREDLEVANQGFGSFASGLGNAEKPRAPLGDRPVGEEAYVNVAAKRMKNGTGPMVGMAAMGMPGAMGANMGPCMAGGIPGGGLAMGLGGMTVNVGLAPNSPPSPDSDGSRSGLSLSPIHSGLDGSVRGRKRGPDGPVEKVVERRMIKNRESAAWSRAWKQCSGRIFQGGTREGGVYAWRTRLLQVLYNVIDIGLKFIWKFTSKSK